jgi:flagellar motility protein MotE (MotC chaperone)
MLRIPAPRLLPATIAALAALLILKCGVLLQVIVTHGTKSESVMVAAANAASTEQTKEHDKPAPQQKSVAPTASSPPKVADGPPPVSDSEKALLQELRQRRQELDARTAALTTRESVLAATEQKLMARLTELQALQKKLEYLDAAHKQREDAGWQGLVKVYETMKPKDAATIFNDLSMPVLLQVLDRMKDAKTALILAAMNPDKARDVTAELAQMRTGHDSPSAPVAGLKPNLTGG